MHYYPVWFDYAKWLFLITGAACGLAMMPEPAGRKRGWLKLGLCCSIALGMLFGGVAGVMFNSRATTHEVTGEAFGVRFTSGRSSSTTWFGVPQPRGEFDFSISGTHGSIANGEALHIVYQDESYAVLAVDVMDGPGAGYRYTDNTNIFSSWFVVALAFVLAGYGVFDWLNDGTAIPPPEDDRAAPDGDVDTKSMLNLSSNE